MRTHLFITIIALMVSACASRENVNLADTPNEQNDVTEYSFLDQGQAARAR